MLKHEEFLLGADDAVTDISLSLDHIPPKQLPSFLRKGSRLMLNFGNATIWIRVDQANEIAAKLMVHLSGESL